MKTKIWYSVRNGGDGSAYPIFMEFKEMTELDQAFMDEGWGEDCNGYIEIESDGSLIFIDDVLTLDQMIADEEDAYRPNARFIEALKKLRGTVSDG
jgi:hypothetical protein